MKKDPQAEHQAHLRQIHALFTKKTQYHSQKAYLELKDIYWLVHEFFNTFLGKDIQFTEEELMHELSNFKHEFMTLEPALIEEWHAFFRALSRYQYAGVAISTEELKAALQQFTHLVDETVGKERTVHDAFGQHLQTAQVYMQHGDVANAYDTYKKLMEEYEHLSEEKRQQHYEQLEHLYQAIVASRSA